jgi:hypothetical protein
MEKASEVNVSCCRNLHFATKERSTPSNGINPSQRSHPSSFFVFLERSLLVTVA